MQPSPSCPYDFLDQHPAPTFALDSDGKVVLWNRACAAMTGLPAEAMLGTKNHWKGFYQAERPCAADLVLKDAIEWAAEYFVAFSDSQFAKGALSVESWCDIPRTGRRIYAAVEAAPIIDSGGAMIGVIETIRDLTRMREAEARLRDLAGLDGLTGLPNRRTFDDALKNEWRRAMRTKEPLSLLMIDLDHFKTYNDNLGHASGDQCLTTVAGVIAGSVRRAGDLPARYGGEEFAVILPSTGAAGATEVAENFRKLLEAKAIRHPENTAGPFVTASVGTATATPKTQDKIEEILRFADQALYHAKDLGRNRTCSFHRRKGPGAATTNEAA